MAKKIPFSNLNIDLLHPQGDQPKLTTQLIQWLLTTGKYIVIVVEIVVIAAFASRFKLDTDLTDLQDKIKQQAPYIESLKEQETFLRLTQFELSTISKNKADTPLWNELLVKITKSTPVTTRLTAINFDRTLKYPQTAMVITGQASSNIELSAFLKAIQNDSSFSNINLANLSYDRQNIIFSITGTINAPEGSSAK